MFFFRELSYFAGDSSLYWASIRAGSNDSLAFLNRDGLAGIDVCEFVRLPAGPLDFDRLDVISWAQSKGLYEFTLRKVAGTAANHLPLFFISRHNPDHRANAIAVRFRSYKLDAQ